MTDSDIRTLKCYLTSCLEPRLKSITELVEKYKNEEEAAKNHFDAEFAANMRRRYLGVSSGLQDAIKDFKELFAEELKEEE